MRPLVKKIAIASVACGLLIAGASSAMAATNSSTSNTTSTNTTTVATSNTSGSVNHVPGCRPPAGRFGPGPGGRADILHVGAQVLGISDQTLMNDLKSGKSMLDVAKSQGVSETSLVAKMKTTLATDLATRNKQIETNFATRVKGMVERTGLPTLSKPATGGTTAKQPPMRRGPQSGGPVHVAAEVLGISDQTLLTDLKSGKSVVDIAQSKGISESVLISKMEAQFSQDLQSAATQAESNFANHATQIVEHSGLPTPPTGAAAPGNSPTGAM